MYRGSAANGLRNCFASINVVKVTLAMFKKIKSFFPSYRFATRERNALLLYNGRFNEKHDFIAVEIVEEQVQLTFSAGEWVRACEGVCLSVCEAV